MKTRTFSTALFVVVLLACTSIVGYSQGPSSDPKGDANVLKILKAKNWTKRGAEVRIENGSLVMNGVGSLSTKLPRLKGSRISFITFKFQAAAHLELKKGSIIQIGGAKIGYRIYENPNATEEDYSDGIREVEIMAFDDLAPKGEKWISTRVLININPEQPGRMAGAPAITIRLDRGSPKPIWDLYLGKRLLVANIGLIKGADASRLGFRLGQESDSVLSEFKISQRNPLFVDRNINGVSDIFERKTLGRLMRRPGERSLPMDDGSSLLDEYLVFNKTRQSREEGAL